jgi:adrenodoxin-NADP+ reductase
MDDAFNTADIIGRDWEGEAKFNNDTVGEKDGYEGVKKEMERRGVRAVSWSDWMKIDAEERRRGKEKGKQREKIRSTEEMMKVLEF